MSNRRLEQKVSECYSTWSETYYKEYFSPGALYPPVHRTIIRRLLKKSGVRSLLDAGCGPASMLRELKGVVPERYGFDLTPEMVTEANRVLEAQGERPGRVWEGSVLSKTSFQPPNTRRKQQFDAAICIGVLPHVADKSDAVVMRNLRGAVKPGGLVVLEARNQLFSLFTLNRYSYDLFQQTLIPGERLKKAFGPRSKIPDKIMSEMKQQFRVDLPPVRKGKQGEPGYDEVLARTHNPFVLEKQFIKAGFENVQVLFYHYHCVPPMFFKHAPERLKQESVRMENPTDWRGYFMASAFLLTGTRV